MSRVPLSSYGRLMGNLRRAAQRETEVVLKRVPGEWRDRIKEVRVQCEDRPGKAMLANGTSPEAFSVTDRDAGTITIFLINLYDVYAGTPGAFREQFRKVLVKELADWAGADIIDPAIVQGGAAWRLSV